MSSAESGRPSDELRQLAELHSLQLSFYDIEGTLHEAPAGAVKLMLGAFGIEVASEEDVARKLEEARLALWQRVVEPVTVAWEGEDNAVLLRLPSRLQDAGVQCTIQLESGDTDSATFRAEDLPNVGGADLGGASFVHKRLGLPQLPHGYHRFSISVADIRREGLIISAPVRGFEPEQQRQWGVFAPLYGCHSERSWGAGHIGDLKTLDDWVSSLGGSLVATLPMFAAFLEQPFEPSPYAPASRLFWNEFYLDLEAVPEFVGSGAAALAATAAFREEIERLRQTRYVDYAGKMKLMRQVLELMAEDLWSRDCRRRDQLRAFVAQRPDVEDYGRFRATIEKQGKGWHEWPAEWVSGSLPADAWEGKVARYHVYVQWLIDEQLREFSDEARKAGGGLYLDFPLGVHPDGYDVWRERDVFVRTLSVGAPPDSVSTKGQNWGFPPLHPERMREQGYSYLIEAIRHPLRRAATLRIDHVMGLHRLFCIPLGHEGDEGVYVRYHEDELFAILALESQRHRATIVGEDLGTVPDIVRDRMNRHGVKRMYVFQYEVTGDREPPVRPVPEGIVASLNTHDMPTFTAYATGLDVDDRIALGLVGEDEAKQWRGARNDLAQKVARYLQEHRWAEGQSSESRDLLRGALAFLAASDAQTVIVNLEDLWGETLPQNTPGTSDERPNWRRKLAWSLEDLASSEEVKGELKTVDRLRRREGDRDA